MAEYVPLLRFVLGFLLIYAFLAALVLLANIVAQKHFPDPFEVVGDDYTISDT